MVSEVCVVSNTSQELITQVLSSSWKWQEGQEDSGCPGAEETAGVFCLEEGKPGIATKRDGKYEKNKSSLAPLSLRQWLQVLF